jgi:hypothetical protein
VLYRITRWGGNEFACLAPPSAPGGKWTEAIISDSPISHGYRPAGSLTIGPDAELFGVTAGSEKRVHGLRARSADLLRRKLEEAGVVRFLMLWSGQPLQHHAQRRPALRHNLFRRSQ